MANIPRAILRLGASAIGLTGAAAIYQGTQILSALTSSMQEAMLAPWTREFHYAANFVTSNVIPDVSSCLSANYAGRVSDADLFNLLGWHGVQAGVSDNNAERTVRGAWTEIIDLGRPRLSANQAQDAWNRGLITTAMRNERVEWDGYRPEDQATIRAERPYPTLDWANDQRRLGNLDDDAWTLINDRNGYAQSSYGFHFYGYADPLDPGTALAFDWRGIWDSGTVDKHLRAAVCRDTIDVEQYRRATRPIPTPSQAVGFTSSGAYNVDIVSRWGLDAEENDLVTQLSHLSGWDYAQPITLPDGTLADGVEYPALFWRQHWHLLSVGRGLDAYHRLRPGFVERFAAELPGMPAFTPQHLQDVFQKGDVAPTARQWEIALSYTEIPLGTIQVLYTFGKRDRNWTIAALSVHKYSDGSITAILDAWDAQQAEGRFAPQRAAASRAITESIKRTIEAYGDGFVSDQDAIQALIADGLQRQTAEILIVNRNLAERHRQVGSVVKRIRTDWTEGALSDQQAVANLALAGVQQWRIASYLTQWTAERNLTAKVATSNQILRWLSEGLLTPIQAQLRLANLGWQAPDIALQLAEVQGRVLRAQAASAAAQAKSARAQVAQIARAQQQAAALIARSQSAARRALPLGTLHSWFLRGQVGEAYARHKLAVSGYEQAAIDDYIRAWKLEQGDYVAPGVAGTLAEKLKLPTVGQIAKWVKQGIISAAEAESELQGLGFSHDDIQHFLQEWGLL